MDRNPLNAPPEMSPPGDADPARGYELFSPQQVGLAAFLGAPIAACWFIARNYRNLGNQQAANLSLFWGVIGTVVLMAVCYYLPDGFPNQFIPIGYTFGLLYGVRALQGDAIARHTAAGGRLGSWWTVVGVGLLCLVAIVGIVFGIVYATMPSE